MGTGAIYHAGVLMPDATALLVIDLQDRFRQAMAGFEPILKCCVRLVHVFRALGLPILVTEQYPKGLGPTVPELLEALSAPGGTAVQISEKTSFSSYGCQGLPASLDRWSPKCVLVCGIETHVCVNQSVHDLLQAAYRVHVAADAVASRKVFDHEVALRKMEQSGAAITTTEMAVFELLRDAKHPKFKELQALLK